MHGKDNGYHDDWESQLCFCGTMWNGLHPVFFHSLLQGCEENCSPLVVYHEDEEDVNHDHGVCQEDTCVGQPSYEGCLICDITVSEFQWFFLVPLQIKSSLSSSVLLQVQAGLMCVHYLGGQTTEH